jgi:hypothetical protein
MMGVLVPETCWGNTTAYFVASGQFFTFTVSTMHGHMNIKRKTRSSIERTTVSENRINPLRTELNPICN